MRRAIGGCLAAVLLLTGCGSTVQMTSSGVVGGAGGDAQLGGPGSSNSLGGSSGPTGQQATGSGSPASAGRAPALSGSGTTTPGSVAGHVNAAGDRSPVQIGFVVSEDAGKTAEALGYGGLSTGDGKRQAEVVTALLNAQGGLGGHKVEPVIFVVTVSGGAGQSQSACSMFFEDHKVKAVVAILMNDVVTGCARQHGVPLVASAVSTTDDTTLAANPELVLPTQPTYETGARNLVDGLVAQGWFRPSSATEQVAIGLITHDETHFAKVPSVVAARLKAAGLVLKDTGYMPYDNDNSDISKASSTGQAIALKFASEGINRVVVVDDHGFGASWFAIGAGSQNYYPRLGLSTMSEPSLEPSVLTPRQLAGSAGIGWAPYLDTSVQFQQPVSPRTTECLAAMKKAGEDTSLASEHIASMSVCEGGFTLLDAWQGRPLTLTAFQQGIASLGSSYRPVAVLGADFGHSRAAAARQRTLSYQAGCNCFRYSGPTRPFT